MRISSYNKFFYYDVRISYFITEFLFESIENDKAIKIWFHICFSALVKVIFSTCLSSEFLIEASKEVFEQSDTIHGLALVMVKYVADNFTNYEKEFQIKFLSDCLIFGPIFKKDQVIFSLTNEFIFHNEYAVNYIEGTYYSSSLRIQILWYASNLFLKVQLNHL